MPEMPEPTILQIIPTDAWSVWGEVGELRDRTDLVLRSGLECGGDCEAEHWHELVKRSPSS